MGSSFFRMFCCLFFCLIVLVQNRQVCGDQCTHCSTTPTLGTKNEYDCSNCGLTKIPKFPSSAIKINLSFNNISAINRKAFVSLNRLKELYFEDNGLSVIEIGSLSSLKSLEVLKLQNNKLNSNSLTELRSLRRRLRNLDIRGNMYKNYQSVSSLRNLNILLIDVFRDFHFDQRFLEFKELSTIIFKPRGIVTLKNKTFEGLRNSPIEELYIHFPGQLDRNIGINFLRPFRFLKRFILDIRGDFDIKDIMKMFYGLRNRKLDLIDVHGNNWKTYRYHQLTAKDAAYLFTICVKELNIIRNSIYYFPLLESLNTPFSSCLEKILLAENFIFWTPTEILGILSFLNLKFVDCSISSRYKTTIRVVEPVFKTSHFHLNVTTRFWHKVEYIDLSGNDLSTVLFNSLDHYTLFLDFPNLKVLKAAATSWSLCNYNVHFNTSLLILDMSGCNCSNLHPQFLQRHQSLSVLNASRTGIAKQMNAGKLQSILHGLYDLENIELSNNNINYLSKQFFLHQTLSLKYINLSYNNLKEIPETLRFLQYAEFVDLSYNNFAYFSKHDMFILDKFRNTSFNFNGNKFECSCKYIDSMIWMAESRSFGQNIVCRDGSNINLILKDIHNLQLKCLSDFWLDFAITCLLLVILIILVTALGYRNKSFVIYLYIKARRLVKQHDRETHETEFEFDAFVSYSHLDYEWVTGTFFRYLKNDLCLKICMHEKDFIPGAPIAEEILRCVESSRKSIFVITRNFLASKWSLFEMDIARHHVLQTDSDTLVVILKEDIPVHEMPMLLRKIWWRIVCLKYPNNDNQQDLNIFDRKISEVFQT